MRSPLSPIALSTCVMEWASPLSDRTSSIQRDENKAMKHVCNRDTVQAVVRLSTVVF